MDPAPEECPKGGSTRGGVEWRLRRLEVAWLLLTICWLGTTITTNGGRAMPDWLSTNGGSAMPDSTRFWQPISDEPLLTARRRRQLLATPGPTANANPAPTPVTPVPTPFPSYAPSPSPSWTPTQPPLPSPSNVPTRNPSPSPSYAPSPSPSKVPTRDPSPFPSYAPSPSPSPVPSVLLIYTVSLSMTLDGLACADYDSTAEAAFVAGLASTLGFNASQFGDTECGDARRRALSSRGDGDADDDGDARARRRLSASSSLAFSISVGATDADDATTSGTAFATAVSSSLTSAVNDGTLTSAITSAAAASGSTAMASVAVSDFSVSTVVPTATPTRTPTPSPTTPAPTTALCSWAPTYEASICETVGGVCYSSEDSCALAGGGEFASEGCGSGECGCCYKFPTSTTVDAGADNAQCIDCGRRLSGRKLLFGHLNCC